MEKHKQYLIHRQAKKIRNATEISIEQTWQKLKYRYWVWQRSFLRKSINHFITETGQSQNVALIEGDTCTELVKINRRNAADLIVINFPIWFEIQVFSWMSLQYWISLQILTEIISYNLRYLLSRRVINFNRSVT